MVNDKMIPEGIHKAYFNRYIIAGKHVNPGYQGAPDTTDPMVILGWELPESLMEDGRPRFAKTYGVGAIKDFTSDKSKKTEIMTGMFMDYVPKQSNPKNYLGKTCRLALTQNISKTTNNPYTRITGWRDFEGEVKEISREPVFFDFYNPTQKDLDTLFPWEVEYLQEATDYKGSACQLLIEGVTSTQTEQPEVDTDYTNNVPF